MHKNTQEARILILLILMAMVAPMEATPILTTLMMVSLAILMGTVFPMLTTPITKIPKQVREMVALKAVANLTITDKARVKVKDRDKDRGKVKVKVKDRIKETVNQVSKDKAQTRTPIRPRRATRSRR